MPRCLAALFCVALLWLSSSAAAAQTPDPIAARLNAASAALDQIDLTLSRHDLPVDQLQALRAQIDPIAASIQISIDELTPRLNAAKLRLDQLGVQPTDKATPEAPAATEARAEQQKLYNDIDAAFRQAHLLAVRAAQTAATIGARRRLLFTRALFERSSSILDPALWTSVIEEIPQDIRALRLLGDDWANGIASRIGRLELALLAFSCLAIIGVYGAARYVVRRNVNRDPDAPKPTRLQKALAALWIALVTASLPIAAASALAFVLSSFDIFNGRLQPLLWAAVDGVKRVAIAVGLARGLMAPTRPNWRPVNFGDEAAPMLLRLVVAVTTIVSAFKFVEAVNDVIAAKLSTSVAARAIGAMLVAFAMANTLVQFTRMIGKADDGSKARLTSRYIQYAPARTAAWAIVVVIAGSVCVGYVAFGAFVVDQIVWIAAMAALLYLGLILADDGVDAALAPTAAFGHTVMSSLGLKRESLEQISVLLSGALHVALVVSAAMLVLAPWGLQSEDLFSSLQAAFFGFTVGDVRISLSTIVVSVLLFLLGIVATRGVQRWLQARYMPRTRLDSGLQNSIHTSVGYLGFIVALSLALSYLGLSFEKFALVAGALSVGIGFGLQSIVSNFVSGLILLWERAIRVGDWIVVGDEQGYVRRINVRSTEIETFDRGTVILPNSNLVSGVVKNWVRTDRTGRVRITLGAAYDSDPEKVREILIACAKAHELVLAIPAPGVFLNNFSETAIEFELICFVDDVEMGGRIKSDLNFAIFKRLQEAQIAIAAPRRDIHVRGFDHPEAGRSASASPTSIAAAR